MTTITIYHNKNILCKLFAIIFNYVVNLLKLTKRRYMTYSEAIKLFDNNVAKMAEALEVTTQLIYHYKKTPDKPLPKLRQLQINMVLQNKGE